MAKTIADPIHPGEILLEEFLKSYNPPVSQTDAADRHVAGVLDEPSGAP